MHNMQMKHYSLNLTWRLNNCATENIMLTDFNLFQHEQNLVEALIFFYTKGI